VNFFPSQIKDYSSERVLFLSMDAPGMIVSRPAFAITTAK